MSSLSNAQPHTKHPKLIELSEHLKAMARVLSRAKQAECDEISGAAFWSADPPSLADDDEVSAQPQKPRVIARPDRFFL